MEHSASPDTRPLRPNEDPEQGHVPIKTRLGYNHRSKALGRHVASGLVRLVRLGFLLLLMLLIFGGWVFIIGPLGNYSESAKFDPSWPEKIDVILSGCDVRIAPTDEADGTISIQYVVWGKSTSYSFNRWAEGVGPGDPNVQSMELQNPTGCEDSADRSCWDLCHATIFAPADTHGFWIRQDANDPAKMVTVTVESGVKMKELLIQGLASWETAGPTLGLHIEPDVEIDNVIAFTDAGPITSYSAGIKTPQFKSLRHNVKLMNWDLTNRDALVAWRQPENKVCIRTVGAHNPTFVEDPDPFKNCNVDEFFYANRLTGAFDGNGDGYIETAELDSGLADNINMCCGGSCPFFSYCGGIQSQIFTPGFLDNGIGDDSRSGIISNSMFVSTVKALNYSSFVPKCTKEVSLAHPDRAQVDSTAQVAYAKLEAENGAVQLIGYQGSLAPSEKTVGVFAPESRVVGIRMLKKDADILRTEITNNYGLPTQNEPIYVVIDVLPSAGIPLSRWIYTTREFYLGLEPAHVQFFSAGILSPTMKHYHVSFTRTDCNGLEVGDYENPLPEEAKNRLFVESVDPPEELTEETTKHVYSQLQIALLPRFQKDLNGMLVLLNNSHKPAPEPTKLVTFRKSVTTGPETINWIPYENSYHIQIMVGVSISVAMGLLISGLALSVFLKYSMYVLKKSHQTEMVKRRLVMMATGVLGEEDDKKESVGDIGGKNFNPLETPLVLIRSIVIGPIRRILVKSLKRFLALRCDVYQPEKQPEKPLTKEEKDMLPDHLKEAPAPPAYKWSRKQGKNMVVAEKEPTMLLSTFFKEYTMYCFDENLKVLTNLNELQKSLIQDHGLLVRLLKIRRFVGCRWINQKAMLNSLETGVWPEWSDPKLNEDDIPCDDTMTELEEQLADTKVIQAFFRLCLESSKDKADVVDVWRPSRDKGPAGGVSVFMAMQSWCKHYKIPMPSMADQDLEALGREITGEREGVIKYTHANCKELRGVQLKRHVNEAKYPPMWYFMEFLTVFMQALILFLLPIICLCLGLSAQYAWASSTAPPTSSPLMWYHVARLWPDVHGKDSIFVTSFLTWLNLAYMSCALVRMVIHYFKLPDKNFLVIASRKLFSWILMLYLYLVIAYLTMVGIWFTLAAIIAPSKFLPYGTAVVVLVIVGVVIWTAMSKSAKFLRDALKTAFKSTVSATLRRHKMATVVKPANVEGGIRKRTNAKGEEIASVNILPMTDLEAQEGELTPEDIFDSMNADGDDALNMAEFSDMFEKLELGITKQQQDRLFAYCDMDCSGTISREEFADGWEYIVEEMVQETLDQMGLGTSQIIVIVASTVLLLFLWFVFIFMIIGVWNETGGFAATIQSLIVAGSGAVSTSVRSKSEAEAEGQSMTDVVGQAMGGGAAAEEAAAAE